ncbi:hypothetical protein QVD17_31626 [Tagetes erecta]|uniref:Uncharacterized protein n=1 Tax=Tagetes erecta TaxID=13708 RepID=A0AAD8K600_TARER|nr:hypothetical protein QVD17_31626 [Tagetes erecta]
MRGVGIVVEDGKSEVEDTKKKKMAWDWLGGDEFYPIWNKTVTPPHSPIIPLCPNSVIFSLLDESFFRPVTLHPLESCSDKPMAGLFSTSDPFH